MLFRSRLTSRIHAALGRAGVDLAGARVLDVGCGTGRGMAWLLDRGVRPGRLLGVDLIVPRLLEARARVPSAALAIADGARLPLRDGGFDVAVALTTLSSMPSEPMRRHAAAEMLRVIRPGGVVLCYEFAWHNPFNPYTVALGPRRLRELFAGAQVSLHRVTLHPLLVRMLLPLGPRVLDALEAVRPLRSHCLALVTKA